MEFRHWNTKSEDGYDTWNNINNNLDVQIGFTGSEEVVKVSVGDDADEHGLGIFATFSKQAPDQVILNALVGLSGVDTVKDLLTATGISETEATKKITQSGEHDQQIMFRIKHNVCRLLVPAIIQYYGLDEGLAESVQKAMDNIEEDYINSL